MLLDSAGHEGVLRRARSSVAGVFAPERPDRLARARCRRCSRWGPTPAAGYAVVGHPLSRRRRARRRARRADLRRRAPAHERARERLERGGPQRRRRRRDPVPQPPRPRRGDGRRARSSAPTPCFSTRRSPARRSRRCARARSRARSSTTRSSRRSSARRRADRLRFVAWTDGRGADAGAPLLDDLIAERRSGGARAARRQGAHRDPHERHDRHAARRRRQQPATLDPAAALCRRSRCTRASGR